LVQSWVPGHIAHQFKLTGLPSFIELETTGQNRVASKKHSTAGTTTIEKIKPMAIGDLAQMTETAALLKRP
jgi:hypothetical protein